MPIEVKKLTHVYMPGTPFEAKALNEVSLSIRDGEFVGIIGHTGSGKSTLISHLNGLERSEPGVVFVNGMDLGEKGADLIAIRRTVGLVFQYPEYQLFEETVAKDVAFGPTNLGLDAGEIGKRVELALRQVGLDPASVSEKSPFELSGGQKRRVAIAGVLAMQPAILILDEPAAGLDPTGRREMFGLIRGIHESGTTVVMVSHSMDDVGRLCDRLFVLNRGARRGVRPRKQAPRHRPGRAGVRQAGQAAERVGLRHARGHLSHGGCVRRHHRQSERR